MFSSSAMLGRRLDVLVARDWGEVKELLPFVGDRIGLFAGLSITAMSALNPY